MAEVDLTKIVLWLKPKEIVALRRLLAREGEKDVGLLMPDAYIGALVEQQAGVC
jgi:hypothetical protein